jgi:hypothetical protein
MAMSQVGLETKNVRAGKGHQQFILPNMTLYSYERGEQEETGNRLTK